jgi:hypothetical protein
MTDELNEFFDEHKMGICSEDCDCSDDAKNHFAILEEGDTLEDLSEVERLEWELSREREYIEFLKVNIVSGKQEVAREIFEEIHQSIKAEKFNHKNFGDLVYLEDIDRIFAELKKKYIGE